MHGVVGTCCDGCTHVRVHLSGVWNSAKSTHVKCRGALRRPLLLTICLVVPARVLYLLHLFEAVNGDLALSVGKTHATGASRTSSQCSSFTSAVVFST